MKKKTPKKQIFRNYHLKNHKLLKTGKIPKLSIKPFFLIEKRKNSKIFFWVHN